MDNYAIPLFAIVDRHKVDLASPRLPELAEQLGAFLESVHGVRALDWRIEILADQPYLVMNGVELAGLPRLFALADVQRTQLFKYRRESAEEAVLTPIAVKPD